MSSRDSGNIACIPCPFGSSLNTRSFSAGSGFRFGFNGKENFDQYQDYGMRIYYPSLGKFLTTDPLKKDYPWYSTYQFAGNKPVVFIDRDGLEEFLVEYEWRDGSNKVKVSICLSDKIIKDQVKHIQIINSYLDIDENITPYFQTVDNFINSTYFIDEGTQASLMLAGKNGEPNKSLSDSSYSVNQVNTEGQNTNAPPFSSSFILNVEFKTFREDLPREFISDEKKINGLQTKEFKIGPSVQPVQLIGTLEFDNMANDIQIMNLNTGKIIYESHNISNTVDLANSNIYIDGNTNITIGVKPSDSPISENDGWAYELSVIRTKNVVKLVETTDEK